MKKIFSFQSFFLIFIFFSLASPAYAQSADVAKIQTFMQNSIQILVTLAIAIAGAFIVYGAILYITSSGNPIALDRSKKTMINAGIGLAIAIGALVITDTITQVAQGAFGK